MRPNRLKTLFAQQTPAVATWMSIPAPFAAELAGHTGCDAVVIDLQHGPMSLDAAIPMLQAVSSTPTVPLARASGNDFAEIGKLLDAGAWGVICPLVNDAREARAFVAACRYPPLGERSFGPTRALLYGGADYFEHANDTVLALAMVETRAGMDALEEIVAVEGLDGVFVGPGDLSLALAGTPRADWKADPLASALARVREVTRAAGRYAGIWCSGPEMASDLARAGWDLVVPGHDAGVLRSGYEQRVRAVRGEVG